MQKIFLFGCIILFWFHIPAKAQDTVFVGAFAGISASHNFNMIDEIPNEYRAHAGITAIIGRATNFAVRTTLMYNQESSGSAIFSYKEIYNSPEITAKFRMDYLQLGIFPEFTKNGMGPGIYSYLGPYAGLLTSSQLIYNNKTSDNKKYVNSFNIGAAIGMGYRFNLPAGMLSIEIAANLDLLNTFKADTPFSTALRPICVQGSIGYSYPLELGGD